MDNKYGLGSVKVATEHHEQHHRTDTLTQAACKYCDSPRLAFCPTMHDHRCDDCGEWQMDVPQGYSTGRYSDY